MNVRQLSVSWWQTGMAGCPSDWKQNAVTLKLGMIIHYLYSTTKYAFQYKRRQIPALRDPAILQMGTTEEREWCQGGRGKNMQLLFHVHIIGQGLHTWRIAKMHKRTFERKKNPAGSGQKLISCRNLFPTLVHWFPRGSPHTFFFASIILPLEWVFKGTTSEPGGSTHTYSVGPSHFHI